MRKRVLLGITGGIAAYKAATIASMLTKVGVDVVVVMTDAATQFITPLTMETLSKNRVITDMFSRDFPYEVEHISLAKSADLALIAPASADFISKMALGIADDMLSTTVMACKATKVICPAMNTNMYEDTACTQNRETLRARGVQFVEPEDGLLACGDIGKGRMAAPEVIVERVLELLEVKPDYAGKKVLITAGATVETIDGVRYLSNFSSGKMGVALAEAAHERGAEVTLVCGRVSVKVPSYIERVDVVSTEDMYDAVLARSGEADVSIMAAAPADYRPKERSAHKIKSDALTLELVKTPDIAMEVGRRKGQAKLVVFAAETQNLVENARKKLAKKNADMVVANDVTREGAGFGVDTNIVTLVRASDQEELPLMSKQALANVLLDRILLL